jgi:hypothetical protein
VLGAAFGLFKNLGSLRRPKAGLTHFTLETVGLINGMPTHLRWE